MTDAEVVGIGRSQREYRNSASMLCTIDKSGVFPHEREQDGSDDDKDSRSGPQKPGV
jgi:hypothetical protein